MKRPDWNLGADPALAARLRLARLAPGALVKLSGRVEHFEYLGMDDGRIRLRSPAGVELLAGPLAVEPVEGPVPVAESRP